MVYGGDTDKDKVLITWDDHKQYNSIEILTDAKFNKERKAEAWQLHPDPIEETTNSDSKSDDETSEEENSDIDNDNDSSSENENHYQDEDSIFDDEFDYDDDDDDE